MRRAVLFLACAACLDAELELPPAVTVIGVSPTADVAEDAPIAVAFSGPVRSAREWPIAVLFGSEPLPIQISASSTSLLIAPAPRWPAGATLLLSIEEGLEDEYGRPMTAWSQAIAIRARATGTQPAIVRTPTPGTLAPMNLAFVAVALGEGEGSIEASLISEHQTIDLINDRSLDGIQLFRVPPFEGLCRPLCPDQEYRIVVDGFESGAGPLGAVRTSTDADDFPPEIIAVKVVFRGGQPQVEICADEPVLARGEARSRDGAVIAYRAVPIAAERVLAQPAVPLDSATPHDLYFEVEDLAGNPAPPIAVPLVTPPAIAIAINEIVASPLRDWNDTEGGGVPFDAVPGIGTVSEADEWIELVNLSEAPIDLEESAIELRTIDGTPGVTPLAGAPGRYFGDGGSIDRWLPGEALVVRVRGAMSSRTLTVEVAAGEQIFDRAVIGEETGADHPGGSPPNVHFESIARTESGALAWCVPTPGDPLPPRDCGY
jgi:hypothetical protein